MSDENNPAEELQIIAGSTEIDLSTGEHVIIREYGFLEGMRIDGFAGDLIKALQDLFLSNAPDAIRLQDLACVLGRHVDITVRLIAMACDRDEAWVAGLSDGDGQLVQMTWWAVNKDFFIRRLMTEAGARAVAEMSGPSDGEKSSHA